MYIPKFTPPLFGQPPTMTSDIGTQHTIAAVNARTRLEGHGVPEAWSWLPHISHIACPKKSKNTGKHDMGNIYI
jgi:hypothetical protein